MNHLYGCFFYFRETFQKVQKVSLVLEDFYSRYRIPPIIQRWNSRSLWSSFGWFILTNFSVGPGLSIGPFQKVQYEVIISPMWLEKMKSRRKLSKNYSIHRKNREISGPYNFWIPVKSNIPDFWNWSYWILFGSETEVRGGGAWPPWYLQWLRPCII